MAVSRTHEEERAWEKVKKRLSDTLDRERAETAIRLFDDNCAQAGFLDPRPTRLPGEPNEEFTARVIKHSSETDGATNFGELRALIPEPDLREAIMTRDFIGDYFGSCPNRDRL
tara:strand:- start:282 stop:623 length:342 start_codon:yes stop_codon:yes gene_type:complete